MPQLMDDFVLKELTGFISGGTEPGREIGAPPLPVSTPMLRPTERDQIETKRIPYSGIVLISQTIYRRESIESQPSCKRRVLVGKSHTPPMD